MKLSFQALRLPLRHDFTISRGTRSSQLSILVSLSDGEACGWGEATCNSYYGHTLESLTTSLSKLRDLVDRIEFGTPTALWTAARSYVGEDTFALAAVDMAAHDLFGQRVGRPIYETLGLTWDRVPVSSYTIGIGTAQTMLKRLEEQPAWPVYKVKLAASDDLSGVRILRQHTSARIRVDANGSWTAEETIAKSHSLSELGVEFIEQPLPAEAPRREHRRVFERSALPVIADESCRHEEDVERCADLFHGINVKLSKCGGITPAVRMLRLASVLGLRTMIGCMVESSVGISAAAQLLPLLDYADLDGAVLLSEDPAQGAAVNNGHITLPDLPGSGVRINEASLARLIDR